ncbi:MAG: cation transporter [Acidobacteria bacterium]|nr:cation transporter [Acidobacteriota bacterium]
MSEHDHHHHDHSHGASQKRLLVVLCLTFGYMLAEVVGGYWSNSLALLSDAGHMFTDVAALALSFFAMRFASRPATPNKTYGFYRLEILAALANGAALIVLSLLICYEAFHRMRAPEAVQGWTLVWIACGGLIVNLISAKLLAHDHHHNLNVRGAFLHVLGDLLGSVAAIAAGLLIVWRGWLWADAAFSVAISLLIIYSAGRLVIESVNVLLEGTPSHINPSAVETALRALAGVQAVHDLHIWTLTSQRHLITAHLVLRDSHEHQRVLREARALLHQQFGLDHATLQLEEAPPLIHIQKSPQKRVA